MLRRRQPAAVLWAVFLFFSLLLLLPFLSGLFLFVVALLLFVFFLVSVGSTDIRRGYFLSEGRLTGFVLMLLVLVFVFSLGRLVHITILFWQL